MDDNDKRFDAIILALSSDPIRSQLGAWKEQRDFTRQTLKEFWTEEDDQGENFRGWWLGIRSDVRCAMVLTSLEDLPNSIGAAALLTVVTPELHSVDELLSNNGNKIIELITMLVKEQENNEENYSFQSFLSAFQTQTETSKLNAVNSLKLARSCILLQFTIAIILIFNNQKEEIKFH